ncbi:MAG TPA: PAS domain-containing sensor histidine kinase [Pseudolabrys sp.]|nr:PAS domain-containing sensor histidine kinase [Pseudolabrys sp.]
MNGRAFSFSDVSDRRLAAEALSPMPTWLWSLDASRVLWANPIAAAIFNAPSPAALVARGFEAAHPAAAQIARLAETLPAAGTPRLQRLRGFGAGFGVALTCLCSRITLEDETEAVLVVATGRAGPALPLVERVRRLLADSREAAAAFSADGELIEATPAALAVLGPTRDLVSLGAVKLAQEASGNGHAEGEIAGAAVRLDRLGAGPTVVLLATFSVAPAASAQAKRRLPLRFVWQIDSANIFTIASDEFIHLTGAMTAAAIGKPWPQAAATLGFGPGHAVSRALATRATWSDITVPWPVEGESEPLPIRLSGLPVNGEAGFSGYRGFGLCRDLDRLAAIEAKRATAPAPSAMPDPQAKAAAARANVLSFPAPAATPVLSPGEHRAFDELARELGNRLQNGTAKPAPLDTVLSPKPPRTDGKTAPSTQESRPILDRLPIGILIYRLNNLIYANRAFLDWTGYLTLDALTEAGGLDSLFIEPAGDADDDGANTLTISTQAGEQLPVEGKLFAVTWNGENALALMLNPPRPAADRPKDDELALRRSESEIRELKAILDTATDGVLMVDRAGRVLSANRSAEALFGYEAADFAALTFGDLFAPESRRPVLDYLHALARDKAGGLLDGGREVMGRVRQGGLIPLFMTVGRVGEHADRFCAVLRDITAWKKTEDELIDAKRQAEKASFAKSEFLAKMSHEIRTPLNAIIGFSEVMMEERFGPVGNDRYREYLRDIHSSGGHLITLLNDLLDLSKIEAGKLELSFVAVNLNDVTQQCVAIMQQQASRDRVIVRTSLASGLPQVLTDLRSLRQIVLNLLSNSIKFTGAGGQVIVSTALTDCHDVVLRVRDTGAGMSEQELQTALEPFRQLASATRPETPGTGLGLPITRALAEANHARFSITSAINDGTLVEITFPHGRLLA